MLSVEEQIKPYKITQLDRLYFKLRRNEVNRIKYIESKLTKHLVKEYKRLNILFELRGWQLGWYFKEENRIFNELE